MTVSSIKTNKVFRHLETSKSKIVVQQGGTRSGKTYNILLWIIFSYCQRNEGKIITICSVQSELGRPTIAPYAASKGALRMLTRTLCAEWAKHGVNVNGVAPGYYATELTSALVQNAEFSDWLCKRVPAGRWGKVEELVGATVFLAAPASDFVHGHLLYVDGGMTAVV
jgi:gluconate 5-dehydrogenase